MSMPYAASYKAREAEKQTIRDQFDAAKERWSKESDEALIENYSYYFSKTYDKKRSSLLQNDVMFVPNMLYAAARSNKVFARVVSLAAQYVHDFNWWSEFRDKLPEYVKDSKKQVKHLNLLIAELKVIMFDKNISADAEINKELKIWTGKKTIRQKFLDMFFMRKK